MHLQRTLQDWTRCQLGQRHEAIATGGEVGKQALDDGDDTGPVRATFMQDNNIARAHLPGYSAGHRLRIARVDIKRGNCP